MEHHADSVRNNRPSYYIANATILYSWLMLKHPLPKDRRIGLAKLYFHISITPGMPTHIIAICADGFTKLTHSKHKVKIDDMRLPWKPIYDILSQGLFLTRRQ